MRGLGVNFGEKLGSLEELVVVVQQQLACLFVESGLGIGLDKQAFDNLKKKGVTIYIIKLSFID